MTMTVMPGKDPKHKHGPGGRPDKLTPELQKDILAAVRSHQRPEVAVALAGCRIDVFYEALRTGARANERLQDGARLSDLSPYERKCAEFSEAYSRAESYSEAVGIRTVTSGATTAQVTEKTTTKCIGKDDDNQPIMVTETTVTRAPGDWRAMAWYLEHMPYSKYRGQQRIELTGADGGPIALEFAARLEAIAGVIQAASEPIPTTSEEVE
jgi:hypothetical protein